MKNGFKKIFILFFFLFSFVNAQDISINKSLSEISLKNFKDREQNSETINKNIPYIKNCTKNKTLSQCSITPVKINSEINQNDVLLLEQRVFMDNYGPLYYSEYPKIIENEFYFYSK